MKLKFSPGVALLLFVSIMSLTTAVADEKAEKVDELFGKWDSTHTPGAALAIIKDGKIIYRKGYGMANLELGAPIIPSSIFRIGSTSKQFTAFCVALLAAEGTIDLDASITKYFPELPKEVYGPATVRHLIHHTSGIRDYLTLQSLRGVSDEEPYSIEEAIEVLSWQKNLNFPPGERFLYSNSGYFLLGELVARASGKSLAEFAKEKIFDPLGMANTHFHDDHTRITPNRAYGYAPKKDGGYTISMTILDLVGDGGVFTSVEEMALWDRAFYEKPYGEEIMDIILTPGTLSDGKVLDYAFGLGITDYKGLRMISHGGGFVGYRAEMVRFIEQKFSVVCLMNTAEGNPSRLCRQIADIYLTDLLKEEEKPKEEEREKKEEPVYTPSKEDLDSYVGEYYCDELKVTYTLELVDSKLYARFRRSPDEPWKPKAKDEFTLFGWVKVKFLRDGQNKITGFVVNAGRVTEIPFERQ